MHLEPSELLCSNGHLDRSRWGTYSSWGGPAEIERKNTLYYVEKRNGPFWYRLARQLTDFGNDGVFIKLQKNEMVEIEF